MSDYQVLTDQFSAILPQVAERRGLPFTRKVLVSDEVLCGGDFDVTRTRIIINIKKFQEVEDLLSFCNLIIDEMVEFDERPKRIRRERISKAISMIEEGLRILKSVEAEDAVASFKESNPELASWWRQVEQEIH